MRHALTLLFAALVLGQGPSPAAAQAPKSLVVQTVAEPPGLDEACGEDRAAYQFQRQDARELDFSRLGGRVRCRLYARVVASGRAEQHNPAALTLAATPR